MLRKKILLLADGEKDQVNHIAKQLEKEGFHIDSAPSLTAFHELTRKTQPDLIIIDMMLSEWPGFELIDKMNTAFKGAIVILTEMEDDVDHVLSLSMGADDYIHKNINTKVFAARIKALLRRTALVKASQPDDLLTVGDLIVDRQRREVILKGRLIDLTAFEFDLLFFLAKRAGHVISRNEIHQFLYSSNNNSLCRAIDMYISRIRKKIGDSPFRPEILKTVRGAGYLLMNTTHTNCDKTGTK